MRDPLRRLAGSPVPLSVPIGNAFRAVAVNTRTPSCAARKGCLAGRWLVYVPRPSRRPKGALATRRSLVAAARLHPVAVTVSEGQQSGLVALAAIVRRHLARVVVSSYLAGRDSCCCLKPASSCVGLFPMVIRSDHIQAYPGAGFRAAY